MSKLIQSRRILSSCVPLITRIHAGQKSTQLIRQYSDALLHQDRLGQEATRRWSCVTFSRSKFASGYSALSPKSLDSIMKLDSVRHASPEELTQIWNEFHAGRGYVSAVMGADLYKLLEQRAKACPLFVFPLRKGNGYVSIFLQAQMPHMLFTALDDYKARGSKASPYMTVTHYNDLADSKGLALVRGDIVFNSRLSDDEANNLLKTAHSFYLDDSRYRKVQQFNKESSDFDYKEVLQELGVSSGP